MKKIVSFILVIALCLSIHAFAFTASAEGKGNYTINDKGKVQIDTNITKAANHKYYTDQVTESVYTITDPASRVTHNPMVRANTFDKKYFLPLNSEDCGTVDKVNINGSNIYVYLPKGYDPESDEKYDVLFMSPASGHKAESFMTADHRKEVFGVSSELTYRRDEMPTLIFKDLFDAITYYDGIRAIYVAIGGTSEFTYRGTKFIAAIQKYVAANYNTYAENDSDDALTDARYHFGIVGVSGGGSLSTLTAMNDYCDRFGYVATVDGSFSTEWDEKHMTPKSVDLFYGKGPEGDFGQCSWPFSEEHYLARVATAHVFVEPYLSHDYMLAGIAIYHIMHNWYK